MFILSEQMAFPSPESATEDGIVAIGGDLSAERLLTAYQQGIFPWPAEGYPLLWFCPDPRHTLLPKEAHIPRSLRKAIAKQTFRITADTAFEAVIDACAQTPRPRQQGTWITPEIKAAYLELYQNGYAHSFEAWSGEELVGGLYGVSIGKAFAGESMFHMQDNASKIAFVTALGHFVSWGIEIVDCQVDTEHLTRFGAKAWERERFLKAWQAATKAELTPQKWTLTLTPEEALELL